MFNRFAAVLHQAVEAIAPTQTLLEDFVFHWKAITHYFINNKDDKQPVQESNIPNHLDNMLVILTQEERQMEANQTGPCMEHLLQHKILETLWTLGKADCPPGMKQMVLMFFTNLLGKIQQPLLPHVNVYRPVHRLVKVCGETRAGPTEKEEIQFLCIVCFKLKEYPYLVNFFLEEPRSSSSRRGGGSNRKTSHDLSHAEFSVVDSLLKLVQSPDARIAVKACEGLMLCASLPEKQAAVCIVNNTQFCSLLAERLCSLYNALPLSMDPVDVESVEAKWGLDMMSDADDTNNFHGKRQLISLLSWFDYCDQVIKEAHPTLAGALSRQIKESFLVPIVEQLLLQSSEVGILTSTAHLAKFVKMTSSPQLLNEFVHFILGDGTAPEKPGEHDHKVRQRLIERCDHLSDEISIMSLKLFEILLKKSHVHIINNLVLRNLESRAYHERPSSSPSSPVASPPATPTSPPATSTSPRATPISPSEGASSPTSPVSPSSPQPVLPASPTEQPSNCIDSNDFNDLHQELSTENRQQSETPLTNGPSNINSDAIESEAVQHQSLGQEPELANSDTQTSIANSEAQASLSNSDAHASLVLSEQSSPSPALDLAPSSLLDSAVVPHPPLTLTSPLPDPEPTLTTPVPAGVPTLTSPAPLGGVTLASPAPDSSVVAPAVPLSPVAQLLASPLSLRPSAAPPVASEIPVSSASPTSPLMPGSPTSVSDSVEDQEEEYKIQRIVSCFLGLIPEENKSSYLTGDTGYDMYLREAHRNFRECTVNCLPYDWPNYPKSLDRCSPSDVFYEGAFIKILFDKLSRMLDQTYEVNLQVTSVLAKIALYPHPHIHEFLLDPFLSAEPGCRTLYSVLGKVVNDLSVRVRSIPEFQKQLFLVRQQLMGIVEEQDSLPYIDLLEGVIVLEEFCKELAAVAFVKFHAVSGR